jgi:hypothetical protein
MRAGRQKLLFQESDMSKNSRLSIAMELHDTKWMSAKSTTAKGKVKKERRKKRTKKSQPFTNTQGQ